MLNILSFLLFIPHGHCYLCKPELVGLHLISDGLIGMAYYSIPFTLFYFIQKRQDVAFRWTFLLFAAFILFCGTTHFMAVWTLWHPNYWVSGIVKACTALVSSYTAIALIPVLPKALDLPGLATRLQASEQRYANLLAVVPVGIFRTDGLGQCVYVNDRWCEIAGLTPTSAMGTKWSQGLHPDDRDRIATEWQKSIQTNRPFQLEYRFQRPGGEVTWVYGQAIAEQDTDGNTIGYVGTITDITDRKQAEAQIQNLIAGTAANVGKDFFPALVRHIAQALDVAHVYVTEKVGDFLQIIAWCDNGVLQPTFRIPIYHTACAQVLHHGTFYCCTYLQEKFPCSLTHKPVESYLGIALRDVAGTTIGTLCILDAYPIKDPQRAEQILSIFAARASAELGRQRALSALENLNQELETKVKERTSLLQEREQFLQTVLDSFPLSVFWKDQTLAYVGCNRNFLEDMNLTDVRAIAGKTDYDMPWSDAADNFRADDRQIMASGIAKLGITETQHHTGGQQTWVEINKVPLYNLEGEAIGILGTYQNITARKRAEIALQASKARLQLITDSLPGCISYIDASQRYQFINRTYEEWFSCQQADILGHTIKEVIGPEAYERARPYVERTLSGETVIYETELPYPGGKTRHVSGVLVPDVDSRMQVYGYYALITDITERKQAEQTIRDHASREKLLREITQRIRESLDLSTIFNTACAEIRPVLQADRVAIFQFDAETYATGEFVAESVVSPFSSVLGITVHDHCFAEEYAVLYAKGRFMVADNLHDGKLTPCYADILTQFETRACMVMPLLCGERLWGLLCIHQCEVPRRWQQSEIGFTHQLANQLAIAIQQANLYEKLHEELTDRQLAQQQLTERNQELAISNQELARATRLKDEFLANMSHELRTPLNAILGMTEALHDQFFGEINDRQLNALSTIERSGSHLLELINEILDVAKIESGKMKLDRKPTAVSPLCNVSLAFIKQQALLKAIQINVNLSPDLPDLCVDERRIRQVLINLLSNAVKFTPEAGTITLEVAHEWNIPPQFEGISTWTNSYTQQLGDPCQPEEESGEQQQYLYLTVTDTGIGIAPEHVDRLFEPFIQIDSALNRHHTGTGLGLTLVKRIVELHGGKVGLTSQVGVGSCFMVGLPCTRSISQFAKQPDGVVNQSPVSHQELHDPKRDNLDPAAAPLILLAEDNEASINTVSSYLVARGYRWIVAKTGAEAIALAQSKQPDLILMDVQMPGMDGLEAIRQIRQSLKSSRPNSTEIPTHEVPTNTSPTHASPNHEVPTHEVPTHEVPTHEVPNHEIPNHEVPTHTSPNHEILTREIPIIALTALAMSDDRDRCLAAGANAYLSKPFKLKQLVITIQSLLLAKENI